MKNFREKLNLKKSTDYQKILSKASDCYYNQGKYLEINGIIITDDIFDQIQEDFINLYPNDPFHKKIGASVEKTGFKKFNHEIPMGSLQKTGTIEDLRAWKEKHDPDGFIVWSEKIDGLSVSLTYKSGNFYRALTRGDGLIGEDITDNVKKMGIPKKLKIKKDFIFRGEIVLEKDKFNLYFKDNVNPRNAAAGTVKRLDGNKSEHLSIYLYNLISNDYEFETLSSKLEFISSNLGLKTPKWEKVKTIDKIKEIWKNYEDSLREASEYEMDGLVITLDDISIQNKVGEVDNRPKFAKALKFTSQVAESVLNAVDWQVGRTGRITPVAKIKPVILSGAKISNVSLHNICEIERLSLEIGQIVKVRRSGDVIPQIIGKIGNGNKKIEIPRHCPSCSSEVKKEEVFLVCKNKNCPAKNYESLLFWVRTLDIKGLGEELVNQLVLSGKVSSIPDFYNLKVEDISSLERRGEKSAKKVLEELHSKKELDAKLFISALGIPNVGPGTIELILSKYPSFSDIEKIKKPEDLTLIHGIGEITAKDFIDGFRSRSNLIKSLLSHITIKINKINKEGSLFGKSFCFSGFRDKNLENEIISAGGKIAASVTKDLSFLVVLDSEEKTGKILKAQKMGIKIVTPLQAREFF